MSDSQSAHSLPWFRVNNSVARHPKVDALAEVLGDPNALAYVIRLWAYTMEFAPSGRLADGAETARGRRGAGARTSIERACAWRGPDGKLWEALVQTGWIDELGDGVEIHDWEEYQGAAVAKARKDIDRKKESRKRRADGARTARGGRADGAGTGRDGTERNNTGAPVAGAPELGVETQPTKPKADPRLAPLRDLLVATYEAVRGCKYLYAGVEDTQGLKRLLPLADDVEINRRWRAALEAGDSWPGTSSLAQFASSKRWNSLASQKSTQPSPSKPYLRDLG